MARVECGLGCAGGRTSIGSQTAPWRTVNGAPKFSDAGYDYADVLRLSMQYYLAAVGVA